MLSIALPIFLDNDYNRDKAHLRPCLCKENMIRFGAIGMLGNRIYFAHLLLIQYKRVTLH